MTPLSPRERQIIRLVRVGKTNKAIATELRLSANTVSTQLRLLYKKLGAHDRAHAVALCFDRGILVPAEKEVAA
jgi:DNA-binding NarL/FixJ family response regulator